MKEKLQSLMKRQDGASAIEYALIAGLIAAVIVTAITFLGGGMGDTFAAICESITGSACE